MDIWKYISPADKHLSYKGIKINNHVHTPWSFSSFDSIDELVLQAKKENISVLGINDFNTMAGYSEFAEKCISNNIFPLFNIELIGLSREDMKKGLKVNDPGNPGRTYISGKGLAYPAKISAHNRARLEEIREKSNLHIRQMSEKVNGLLQEIDKSLSVDFDDMLANYTLGMVRERHLAAMIRRVIAKKYTSGTERDRVFARLLGDDYKSEGDRDSASLENIIRSKLLKAGGKAFVEEDPAIFIDPVEIRNLILDAGGIPTYPFLADFKSGEYTDFEHDREEAAIKLIDRGFYSVEFIPVRNDFKRFRDYALFLHRHGFIVSFGTEHNVPGSAPLEVQAGGGAKLDDDLLNINLEAAAILAAHQYRVYKEGEGYLDSKGKPKIEEKMEYIELGKKLIGSVVGTRHKAQG
ncbi:MAG: PHP domain-containing protein [Marinilabiliaceae bacterium]|jgi:hypothetical protein|nr:PHP domain-containing protein [Marinilabiliaceae bacterium]